MKRRELVLMLGGAMTAARGLRAQQKAMPVIGYLSSGSPGVNAPTVTAFRQGLSETGYIEGKNVAIEYRWAEGRYDRLPTLAANLIDRKVDVIVASGANSPLVAKSATSTIPIVFFGGDPVAAGLVTSFARPGGNLTGVSLLSNGLLAKQIAILHEAIAQNTTIGFLVRPANPNAESDTKDVVSAAEALGHKLVVAKANTEAEIAPAIAALVDKGSEALIIFPDVLFISNIVELAEIAAEHKLPAIYNFLGFAAAGGLLCYGANQNDAYAQAGIYAGRILRGAKPSELPVMQSSRFELILNLKTAKAFGTKLSPTLLATVDRVIE